MIVEGHRNCPSSPLYVTTSAPISYEPFQLSEPVESLRLLLLLGIASGCIIIALFTVITAVKLFVGWRHRRWLRSLPRRDLKTVLQMQTKSLSRETSVNNTSTSMFCSDDIPRSVRLSMPFVILGNVGFFLSGHLSLGAT
jgi:hypothetical protein